MKKCKFYLLQRRIFPSSIVKITKNGIIQYLFMLVELVDVVILVENVYNNHYN